MNPALKHRLASLSPHVFIVLVYSLMHGVGLLNRGLFWDDWVFWQQDKELVARVSRDMGSTWTSHINHILFYSDAGPTVGRTLSFLALLAAALFLFGILRRLPGITVTTAMWVAVVFSTFPGYTARQAIVMVGYALCLAYFTAAVWLLVRNAPRPGVLVRLTSAALFIMSFHTRSLLVLCAALPLTLLLVDPPETWRPWPITRKLLTYADQLVLPFAFWMVTRIWYQPRGLYAGYNTLLPEGTNFSHMLWSGIVHSNPMSLAWTQVGPEMSAFLFVALLFAPLMMLGLRRWPIEHRSSDLWLVDAGAFLVVLGVAPYAAVGKIPMFAAFETRHQLLIPFGWGAVITAIVQAHARHSRFLRVSASVALALIISFFGATHLQSYIGYQREWLKAQALMEAFVDSGQIRQAHTILFVDKTENWNAGHRVGLQHYEYSGMLAQAFGEQTRLGIDRGHLSGVEHAYAQGWSTLERNPYYKLADWKRHDPDYVVTIRRGDLDLTPASTVLRLTALDWLNRSHLREELGKAVELRIRPYRWKRSDPLIDYTLPPQAVP